MRLTIILLFTLLFSLGSSAQQAVLECLTVGDVTGAVSLRFSYDGTASAYEIYRSDQITGTYELIHTTSSSSTTITISVVGVVPLLLTAAILPRYQYHHCISTCGCRLCALAAAAVTIYYSPLLYCSSY